MNKRLLLVGVSLAVLFAAVGAQAKGRISGYRSNASYGTDNTLYQWEIGDKVDGSDTRNLGIVDLTTVFGYAPQLTAYGDIAMLSDRRVLLSHRNAAGAQAVSVLTCLYDGSGLLTNCVVDWTSLESGRPISPLPNGAFACHRGTTIAIYKQTAANTWTLDTTGASRDAWPRDMAGLITASTNEVATSSQARDAYRIRPSGWVAKYAGGGGGATHPWWDYAKDSATTFSKMAGWSLTATTGATSTPPKLWTVRRPMVAPTMA